MVVREILADFDFMEFKKSSRQTIRAITSALNGIYLPLPQRIYYSKIIFGNKTPLTLHLSNETVANLIYKNF